ncbi:MAG: response regulator [Anaerolineae bacterium]|nr:response regulator [Anaerolineae bacterium]MDW8099796.1 response regulator [Anaerolineae bacterium]
MISRTEFANQLTTAYERLYDLVYLRTHPLADLFVPDPTLSRKDKAWRLHHLLIEVIEELDPGPHAPVFSREWRRHRLMVLRYIDGLDPQSVADQLAISRRHFYREHEAAIEAIASILWQRYVEQPSMGAQPRQAAREPTSPSRLELLRLEAARLNQANRYTSLSEVLQGAVQLVGEMARQKGVKVQMGLGESPPGVGMDRSLLRQLLLEALSYLVEHLASGEIQVSVTQNKDCVRLSLQGRGTRTPKPPAQAGEEEVRLKMLQELAEVQQAQIRFVASGQEITGFELELPNALPRTILVVDDNADVLRLFQRYLSQHHYQVVTAQTSAEAIELAQKLQPYAITLDLMMPDQDGWDVLQTLTNQPQTRHIPIIVCTVLSARELALSLGAALFLEKPVTEQALLSALEALS